MIVGVQRQVTSSQCPYWGGGNAPVHFRDKVDEIAELVEVFSSALCREHIVREMNNLVPLHAVRV
jgi:hypothetical protein